jgi:LysM repeat protein
MGQLEKYGLYVLCLVIFLILGVSIWGGGDLPQQRRSGSPSNSELKAGTSPSAARPVAKSDVGLGELEALLRPEERPKSEPKSEPKKNDAKAVDASAGKGAEKGGDKVAGGGSPAPAPPPAPAAEARQTHKVQSGDTFESISKLHFGTPALRAEIGRLNSRLEPTKLKLGQDVLLPTAAEAKAILERAKPKPTPEVAAAAAPGTYRIKKGDTLEGIALRELGSRSRVADLQAANPGVTVLKIDTVIKLPKK